MFIQLYPVSDLLTDKMISAVKSNDMVATAILRIAEDKTVVQECTVSELSQTLRAHGEAGACANTGTQIKISTDERLNMSDDHDLYVGLSDEGLRLYASREKAAASALHLIREYSTAEEINWLDTGDVPGVIRDIHTAYRYFGTDEVLTIAFTNSDIGIGFVGDRKYPIVTYDGHMYFIRTGTKVKSDIELPSSVSIMLTNKIKQIKQTAINELSHLYDRDTVATNHLLTLDGIGALESAILAELDLFVDVCLTRKYLVFNINCTDDVLTYPVNASDDLEGDRELGRRADVRSRSRRDDTHDSRRGDSHSPRRSGRRFTSGSNAISR